MDVTPNRLLVRSQPRCKEQVAGLGRTGAVAGRLVGLAARAGGWPGLTSGRLLVRNQLGWKEKVAGLGRTGSVAGRLVGLAARGGGWPGRTSGRLPTLARHAAKALQASLGMQMRVDLRQCSPLIRQVGRAR